jgi:hypothetical protein
MAFMSRTQTNTVSAAGAMKKNPFYLLVDKAEGEFHEGLTPIRNAGGDATRDPGQ